MEQPEKKRPGWQPGRPRLEGGPVVSRGTVALTGVEARAAEDLGKLWGTTKIGDIARRAIRFAAAHLIPEIPSQEGEPATVAPGDGDRVCPTCSHWSWDTSSCNAATPETKAWSDSPDASIEDGMVVGHVQPCPAWR